MKTKKLLAIENSLYEFIGNNKFIHEPIYDIGNIKDFYEQVIDFKYSSYLNINQFLFSENNQITRMESTQELFTRVTDFIEEIFKRYLNTQQTILLVTHEGVIKQIETYLYQYVLRENKKYLYIRMGEIREFNLETKSEEK